MSVALGSAAAQQPKRGHLLHRQSSVHPPTASSHLPDSKVRISDWGEQAINRSQGDGCSQARVDGQDGVQECRRHLHGARMMPQDAAWKGSR